MFFNDMLKNISNQFYSSAITKEESLFLLTLYVIPALRGYVFPLDFFLVASNLSASSFSCAVDTAATSFFHSSWTVGLYGE
jgi:hypothetical protein